MSEIFLCRKVTKDVPRFKWIASLSNGETIFEDKVKNIGPTWERLADYIEENSLSITNLRLDLGRLQLDNLPAKKPGYIQIKKVKSMPGVTINEWGIGYLDDNGKALVHYVTSEGSSYSKIIDDPGPPFTIYNRSNHATSKP